MTLVPGTRLAHYEIVAPLGAGGMGEVYRATDSKLGRQVAIKVLPGDVAHDADRLARFQREARAVAALNHPHIVTLHSVEAVEGVHFLTMELIEGQPLDRAIPGGGLALDRVLSIGISVSEALVAAHERGITHRDLKPANIMLTTDSRVKVLDFGLAKDLRPSDADGATVTVGEQTEPGLVMGTPGYMSPEQITGAVLDHRTDIFSLGVILYQMAAGARPFGGATSMEVASAILRDAPRPLNEVRPGLPVDLARVIRRCLEKDPRDRIQTARDVANELRDIEHGATSGADGHEPVRPRTSGIAVAMSDEGFRVAIMAFKPIGTIPELATLADGLTDEIVTALSRFSYLRVVTPSGDNAVSAPYLLEGKVRHAGTSVRVTVQLVEAQTGAHLWAETYARSFQPDTLFELQDDLVPRIVATVADQSGVLVRSIGDQLRSRSFDDLTPHDAFLMALSFQGNAGAHQHVRAALERAVERAPDYADALAALAEFGYLQEYQHGYNPRPDPLGRALVVARRAVAVAPANHFAHSALASVFFFQRNLPAFRNAAERSLALNMADSSRGAFIGALLAFAGEWERGCELVQRAIVLNPHHPGWMWLPICWRAYSERNYVAALDAAVKVNLPHYFFSWAALAASHAQLGNLGGAQDAVQQLVILKPDFARTGREEFSRWFVSTELVDHILDGLRMAGLTVV